MAEKMYRKHVLICAGASCISSGGYSFKDKLIEELEKHNLQDEIKVVDTGCVGTCELGPVAIVYPEGTFYKKLKPEDAIDIVEEHFIKGRPVKRLLYEDPQAGEIIEKIEEMPFFSKQMKIVLRNSGVINPESLEEYVANDGYAALAKVLTEMSPDDVINEIKKSGLRGRGGAGFPTGLKWEFVKKSQGEKKFVICNADEGDPGAFMDRSVLEGDPFSVIEAMTIAGYAVGAQKGYIYVRAEYPLAIKRLKHAINKAYEENLLGDNIFDRGFKFDLEIRVGAGAFVCGEETALMHSIEGKRGMPRPKPPFPAQSGLWGYPTLINNVETYANICPIILKGGDWFASIGTEKSKGTKVFALAGDINNTGLVEVPMGTTLGEVIYDIGGGLPKGKKFKAAQTGGPSGGCIPAQYLNVPMDYESLKELGAIMGSGGLIVMSEDTCMVDLARYFLEFCQEESCGKCPPCRIGTKRMLEILEKIAHGEGELEDIDRLVELGNYIKDTALCGLGQTAPNPVLSTIKYFREEYEAHIIDKKCPAGVCAALMVAPCTNTCPAGVDVPTYIAHIINEEFDKAFYVHMEKNPFPSICGRVCPHPCENKCLRGKMDDPIAIADLKRFMADYALEKGLKIENKSEKKGKKVGIVGAGPAGLSAAYYLALAGYDVDVYEALPVAGGMMYVGIPEYRLPRDILEAEIERIKDVGVNIYLNSPVKDLDEFRKNYDAVYVAVGAHKSYKMGIEGEDLEGVFGGIEYLKEVNLGKDMPAGKKVAVIGGGNTAIDVARTLRRKGAEVTIYYRRTIADMPAEEEEIEDAMDEGIVIETMVSPVKILGNGKVEKLVLQRMKGGEFDSSGRRRPVPIEGSEFEVEVDMVVSAIGQEPDLSFAKDLIEKKGSKIVHDKRTFKTKTEGIFVGGDMAYGADTVVRAIASGRKAAVEIDKYLGGTGDWEKVPHVVVETNYDEEEYQKERPRKRPPKLNVDERLKDFREVKKKFSLYDALEEAKRCLHCDRKEEDVVEEVEVKPEDDEIMDILS